MDGRRIWKRFVENYHLFRGTPTRLWMDYVLSSVLGIDQQLDAATADSVYDHIADKLRQPEYRPRALFKRFNIAVIATPAAALDDLRWHTSTSRNAWDGGGVPAYPPTGGRATALD